MREQSPETTELPRRGERTVARMLVVVAPLLREDTTCRPSQEETTGSSLGESAECESFDNQKMSRILARIREKIERGKYLYLRR